MDRTDTIGLKEYIHVIVNETFCVLVMLTQKKVFLKQWKADKLDRTDTIGLQEHIYVNANKILRVLVMLNQKTMEPKLTMEC